MMIFIGSLFFLYILMDVRDFHNLDASGKILR